MRQDGAHGVSAAVVLVEGDSDRLALAALATRLGLALEASGVVIVAMGGVTNLRRHLVDLAARSPRPRVVALFDAPEEAHVRRVVGLERADDDALGARGLFACDPDLEGALIAALGTARVEELLAEHGELDRFRAFQQQPAQRERPTDAQLRRFMGTHSGRKARFAPILVGALDTSRVPLGLSQVFDAVFDHTDILRGDG